jgi:peptidoglycan/LPS O-acetylase OafA/YrhL
LSAQLNSSPVTRVGYLDGWRGLAICLVLQAHFLQVASFDSGSLGVDVFFCLSGMLMAEILFVRRAPLATFYQRRASRILPAFFAYVLITYGVLHLLGKHNGPLDFVATLTFLRSYIPATPDIWSTGMPIGHIWSLNVEEHSYLLLSLVALCVRRRAGLILIGIGLLSFAIHVVYLRWWGPMNWRLHTEVMAANIFLAAGYRLVRPERVPRALPLVAVAIAATCYAYLPWWWAQSMLAPLLLAFSVNHLEQLPGRWILETPVLRRMGIWSFSLYLWQQPYYDMRDRLGIAVGLSLAIATGLASYYLLERPARTWLNGTRRPRQIPHLAQV